MMHYFGIGQMVQFTPSLYDKARLGGVFKVLRQLPPEGAGPQYRIQSTRDGHERIVVQASLTACTEAAKAGMVRRTAR